MNNYERRRNNYPSVKTIDIPNKCSFCNFSISGPDDFPHCFVYNKECEGYPDKPTWCEIGSVKMTLYKPKPRNYYKRNK